RERQSMRTKTEATIEDLYAVEGQAELVNGKIVPLPSHTWPVAIAIGEILYSLHEFVDRGKRGYALGSTVAYVIDLPHRKAFCPDVALYTGDIMSMKFLEGAPILAVEVRDPDDYGQAAEVRISAKRVDYFAAGTLVVWDVDLLSDDVVRVYRMENPDEPTIYRRGQVAEAEPAVPGWTMPVDSLFPQAIEKG
ncbi:MAG: Uma2 family endonuclease, partial [Chloroflexia bacterium]